MVSHARELCIGSDENRGTAQTACVACRTPGRERNVIMEKKHAVCMLCAKPSSKAICDVCADHLRGEALDKKKKEEKIRE